MAGQLELGRRFGVTETRDFEDGTEHVARFQPGLSYRVTSRNRAFVQGMIAEGVAALQAAALDGMNVAASRGDAAGRVSVGKSKEK